MNLKEVKDLLQEILRSDISEFELEHTGTKVRFRRGHRPAEVAPPASPPLTALPAASVIEVPPAPPARHGPKEDAEDKEASEADIHAVNSPIVGTFYRSPSPGAEPYVKIGDTVEEGTILCVIEAMKLMNEIPSDVTGEVTRIYVENSHPVEFGQKLFGIRPRR